jgi:hypothetical protein
MGTVSFNQENHNFVVQIGKNKCNQWYQITQVSIIRLELI